MREVDRHGAGIAVRGLVLIAALGNPSAFPLVRSNLRHFHGWDCIAYAHEKIPPEERFLWALGCIMGDILLGSSRRLFDVPWADDEQATKPSVQVEMLLLAMGPPSIEALRAMMIDEHLPPSFSSWLHLRPKASSIYCWRKRLVAALIDGDMSLAHCFPTKGPADHRLRAEAIVQFIQLMLNFNPKDRPTAYELSRMTRTSGCVLHVGS